MVHWGWFVFLILTLIYSIIDDIEIKSELRIKIARLETEVKMLREQFGLPVEPAEKGQEDNS